VQPTPAATPAVVAPTATVSASTVTTVILPAPVTLTLDTVVPAPTQCTLPMVLPTAPALATAGATALPTLVVKQPQLPKPYNGSTSWKSFKERFECICRINGWTTVTEQVQYLSLSLDGPAADILKDIDESSATALDDILRLLSRRFGQTDAPGDAMRRFDARRQLDGESIPEFESAIRSLHREAWPNATHAQRDSDLKRKFEYGVSHPDLLSHLQIHARYDNFENTVLKARYFIDAHEIARAPKKIRANNYATAD